jgi:hypothetical protein
MVGNLAFANYVSGRNENYRVTHAKDLVPKLPAFALGYALGPTTEYWITSGNGVTVGTSDIQVSSGPYNLRGNKGQIESSIDDHLFYFNSISACGPQNLEFP